MEKFIAIVITLEEFNYQLHSKYWKATVKQFIKTTKVEVSSSILNELSLIYVTFYAVQKHTSHITVVQIKTDTISFWNDCKRL